MIEFSQTPLSQPIILGTPDQRLCQVAFNDTLRMTENFSRFYQEEGVIPFGLAIHPEHNESAQFIVRNGVHPIIGTEEVVSVLSLALELYAQRIDDSEMSPIEAGITNIKNIFKDKLNIKKPTDPRDLAAFLRGHLHPVAEPQDDSYIATCIPIVRSVSA